MAVSDEEFKALLLAGKDAPEGSEARAKYLAAVKVRQQEDFDRSTKGNLRPGVQAFKESNPQLFSALQLLWIVAVIGVVIFPGAFSGMFGAQ